MRKFTTKYCNLQKISHKRVVQELLNGKKLTPWLFFTFPVPSGRFKNPLTKYFEIQNYSELDLFVSDKLINRHLRHYLRILLSLNESNPESILGNLGAKRLKSSLTMLLYIKRFKHYAENLLNQYYDGNADTLTVKIMEDWNGNNGNRK